MRDNKELSPNQLEPRSFVYNGHPSRVIFGFGTLDQVVAEVRRLGRRALVLSTPQQVDQAHGLADRWAVSPSASLRKPPCTRRLR